MVVQLLEDPCSNIDQPVLLTYCKHGYQRYHYPWLSLKWSNSNEHYLQWKERRISGRHYSSLGTSVLQLDYGCVHWCCYILQVNWKKIPGPVISYEIPDGWQQLAVRAFKLHRELNFANSAWHKPTCYPCQSSFSWVAIWFWINYNSFVCYSARAIL